jgi:hypothetical protein
MLLDIEVRALTYLFTILFCASGFAVGAPSNLLGSTNTIKITHSHSHSHDHHHDADEDSDHQEHSDDQSQSSHTEDPTHSHSHEIVLPGATAVFFTGQAAFTCATFEVSNYPGSTEQFPPIDPALSSIFRPPIA